MSRYTVLPRTIAVTAALGAAVVQTNACGTHVAENIGAIGASAGDAAAAKFRWPVRGSLEIPTCSNLSDRDHIDIIAPQGTVVKAAANGVVAYAGNELKGYGNLILIRHDDGWITAYALNRKLLVERGQQVRRGQPIARMAPLLHFEMRRGSQPQNPLNYLPATQGVRD